MENIIPPSELILNDDGSVYHLTLTPDEISDTIILVGDSGRVPMVSRHFDRITLKKSRCEYITHVGELNGQPIMVVSTGVGTGNIDVIINELDALANIDFTTRTIKKSLRQLKFIRLGTSGGFSGHVELGDLIASRYVCGFDNLADFYVYSLTQDESELQARIEALFEKHGIPHSVSTTSATESLIQKMDSFSKPGITFTCPGFFAPQGRKLRAIPKAPHLLDVCTQFAYNGIHATNFEMDSSAIYRLSQLLGHQCCSLSVILANRSSKLFITNPNKHVDRMIQNALSTLSSKTTLAEVV